MTLSNIHTQDAIAVAQLIHAGELTSEAVTEHLLSRIERHAELGPYVTVAAEQALAQARQADQDIQSGKIRSALHGVPIAVKDLLATRGLRTTNGTRIYRDAVPDYDATVVARLNEAGTILLGKLHLTEGAFARHHPDVQIPINPWDAGLWSGVSSSGSGVATASGLCFASLGTDTGGSIRFPSASNGIVGLKPTYGRVSRYGAFPLAYSLDHIGPMTRSVRDAAAMLQIIAGFDANDPTSSRRAVPDYLAHAQFPSALRIGIDLQYNSGQTAQAHRDALTAALSVLERQGCEIVPITIDHQALSEGWPITTAVEALHAHADTFPARRDDYGPLADLLEMGLAIPASAYMQVEMERRAFNARLDDIFTQCDLIVCPSMPMYQQPKEGSPEAETAEANLSETLKYTAAWDYSGSPTLSLPWPTSHGALPASIQLIGRHFDEATLIAVGQYLEQERGPIAMPLD